MLPPIAAVARNSYVHPAVIEAYLDGRIGGALIEAAEDDGSPPGPPTEAEEAAVVRLLKARAGGPTRVMFAAENLVVHGCCHHLLLPREPGRDCDARARPLAL